MAFRLKKQGISGLNHRWHGSCLLKYLNPVPSCCLQRLHNSRRHPEQTSQMFVTPKHELPLHAELNSDSVKGSQSRQAASRTKPDRTNGGVVIGSQPSGDEVHAESQKKAADTEELPRQQPPAKRQATSFRPQFRCNFCRDPLKPTPWNFTEVLLACIGLRHLYCPHCFGIALRPFGLMTLLLWPLFAAWRGLAWLLGE